MIVKKCLTRERPRTRAMLADRYGLPLSTSWQRAREAYVAGADCILGATAWVKEHLNRVIEADPGFALAHAALGRGLFVETDVPAAREAGWRAPAAGALAGGARLRVALVSQGWCGLRGCA